MTTLLIDIGNSRIKWALLSRAGKLGRQYASDYAGWTPADARRILFGAARGIERVAAVSVAPAAIGRVISQAASVYGIGAPRFIRSARRLGGVTTRYTESWRLGADRMVAAVGAHALVGARGACVIDVGTAMTLDLVDADGVHLGGAIVPGPALMVAALLKETNGIKRRAGAARRAGTPRTLFARNTRTAIEAGADYAVAAVIDRALLEARAQLGRAPVVLLTGGAALRIRPMLRTHAVRSVPNLVLIGLAELAKTPLN